MIRLTTLSHPRLAQAFVDYMTIKHIVITLKPVTHQEIELWLADEQQFPVAEKELTLFLENPSHPRYADASWQISRTNSPLRYSHFPYWKIFLNGGGKVTHSVTLLSVLVYLLMQFDAYSLFSWLSFPSSYEQKWQLWRWITPTLLHFSLMHILFNLVMWWYVGGMVERRLSSQKLLQLTLAAALVSACAQSLFSGAEFGGLSGVVYALIGYVWLSGERAPERGLHLPRAMIVVVLLFFIIDYFDFFAPIANAAHFSGLCFGLMMAYWDNRTRRAA